MSGSPRSPLPLFVRLEGLRVLVVGAGPACEPKIEALVEAGARVHVVAPVATPRVRALAAAAEAGLTWEARPFVEADLDEAWLVVSATGDAAVQRAIAVEAARRHLFVLAIDDPANGSAASGYVLRRPPFVVAISSSGEAPALTRLLREVLERTLPAERWVEAARALRREWKQKAAQGEPVPHGARFRALVRALAAEMDEEP